MLMEVGGLLGWLIVIAFIGTILNYIIKFLNKKVGKKITESDIGKKIWPILMRIFVRNHRFFGWATVVFLIFHFIIQFSIFGISVTGGMVAFLLIWQVLLGGYAHVGKKARKGMWFWIHRTIAVLIVAGIILHLIMPFGNVSQSKGIQAVQTQSGGIQVAETQGAETQIVETRTTETQTLETQTEELPTYTLEELATYNGQDGMPAYVAYEGNIYDVTGTPGWESGSHMGQSAGTDVTDVLSRSPHGESALQNLDIVGTLEG